MHQIPSPGEIDRCYRILELDPGATRDLVTRSWCQLVDEWRPDRFVNVPDLHQRAQARVKDLNYAHDILDRYLGGEVTSSTPSKSRTSFLPRPPKSRRHRPLVASSVFAGMAIVAVLFVRPLFSAKSKPAEISHLSRDLAPVASAVAPASVPQEPQMLLVAHAPVRVTVSLVADGRILLNPTDLAAGQTVAVARLGPTYIKYSAGENLELEIDGRRYAMPDTGPSRAKIN